MSPVNLLPTELAPSNKAVKLAEFLKKFSITGLVVLIVAIVGLGVLFYTNSLEIKNLTAQETRLKNSISSLEVTEKSLYLLSDRIDKAGGLLADNSIQKDIGALDTIISSSPGNLVISDADISTKKCEISLVAANSAALSQFLAGILSSERYSHVLLKTLSFNPNYGYMFSIQYSAN